MQVSHIMVRQPPSIERVDVRVCRLPTDAPEESDGTATWNATTMVIAEVSAAGVTGLGYSYIDAAAAQLIRDRLEACILGASALAIPQMAIRMAQAVRNDGRRGIAACAISAVDVALWDLKAKLLDLPLATLLGPVRLRVPAYASGGFTSTGLDALEREVTGYVERGYKRVKIKIGREPTHDLDRVRVLAAAAGPGIEIMVDANGAYTHKQATVFAERAAEYGVVYFEEPVTADDLDGLRFVRHHAPMSIAAGEYGYDPMYFRRMLEANAVDILQADATRCLGVSGFLQVDALCDAFMLALSSHCAPAIHAHVAAAARRLVHVEHFHDHVRMEHELFDGAPALEDGALAFDRTRPGLGLVLRSGQAQRLAA